jgi:hypothetical protein
MTASDQCSSRKKLLQVGGHPHMRRPLGWLVSKLDPYILPPEEGEAGAEAGGHSSRARSRVSISDRQPMMWHPFPLSSLQPANASDMARALVDTCELSPQAPPSPLAPHPHAANAGALVAARTRTLARTIKCLRIAFSDRLEIKLGLHSGRGPSQRLGMRCLDALVPTQVQMQVRGENRSREQQRRKGA